MSDGWKSPFTGVVLILMFAVLLTDRVGTDATMAAVLTIFTVTEIISMSEALNGFSNSGLISVLVLFMVAEGMSRTGALDWYMGKILGQPKSAASAQLRLMLPLTIFSAFLNNTPIVTVLTPIVLNWAKNNKLSPKQLLIPLSYGAIFGGTCTLIGTSTNLVVSGLLGDRYPGLSIAFFELAYTGVPIALIGISYILIALPYLLPDGAETTVEDEDVLLKARVTPYSSAANRTLQRSGLRDTGGIYLVSVKRAATGNVHHAVGRDFVLSTGDILYFTGLIEEFNDFCTEHGLEMVTEEEGYHITDSEAGSSKEALLSADPNERARLIYEMTDLIHKQIDTDENGAMQVNTDEIGSISLKDDDRPKIVVAYMYGVISVGVNASDRNNLLHDISRGLSRLNLKILHSEAAVIRKRSISVWKCTPQEESDNKEPDIGEMYCVLEAIPGNPQTPTNGKNGKVVRSVITPYSRLVHKSIDESDFKETYKASILALMRNGKNYKKIASNVHFKIGDILILLADKESPLLNLPPSDFYKNMDAKFKKNGYSSQRIDYGDDSQDMVWMDLQVDLEKEDVKEVFHHEFVIACKVESGSSHQNKTIAAAGLDRLPGVRLLSIERGAETLPIDTTLEGGDVLWFAGGASAIGHLRKVPGLEYVENEEIQRLTDKLHSRKLVQAVVSRSGPLIGKTVREVKFRTQYGAAVIAVHREGKRILDHPGTIKLQAGDVLLLEAGPMFLEKQVDKSLTLLTPVEDSAPPRVKLFFPALAIVVAMIASFTSEVVHLNVAAMIAVILMITIGVMSEEEARQSLNWYIYVTIACAFGVGQAMVNSNLASDIAGALVRFGEILGIGDAGIIGAIYGATFFISNMVTNNAAAALLFPVALDAADKAGVDRKMMAYAVIYGASACFLSPFGYQTHLIVFQPGGYKTADFLKIGTPLQFILLIATVLFLINIDRWAINWLISVVILAASIAFKFSGDLRKLLFGKQKDEEDDEDENIEEVSIAREIET